MKSCRKISLAQVGLVFFVFALFLFFSAGSVYAYPEQSDSKGEHGITATITGPLSWAAGQSYTIKLKGEIPNGADFSIYQWQLYENVTQGVRS